ncbi:hypothetical protein GGF48_002421, partial [Coemansia sp. RSA 921]
GCLKVRWRQQPRIRRFDALCCMCRSTTTMRCGSTTSTGSPQCEWSSGTTSYWTRRTHTCSSTRCA